MARWRWHEDFGYTKIVPDLGKNPRRCCNTRNIKEIYIYIELRLTLIQERENTANKMKVSRHKDLCFTVQQTPLRNVFHGILNRRKDRNLRITLKTLPDVSKSMLHAKLFDGLQVAVEIHEIYGRSVVDDSFWGGGGGDESSLYRAYKLDLCMSRPCKILPRQTRFSVRYRGYGEEISREDPRLAETGD